jgi:hypothetical protein
MNEICCQFGEGNHLAGIITEPEGRAPRGELLLINAGLTPKFGPFRLYAELARRLSRDGWRTLRFDLGGIGDSQQLERNATLRERTGAEIHAAIDRLRTPGAGPLVVGGLCSGAEDAFLHAEADARCDGVLLIDPFAYRTPGWQWRNLLVKSAKQALGAVGLYRSRAAAGEEGAPGEERALVDYEYLAQPVATRIAKVLVARRARMHFIYTGGMSDWFNHPAQLQEMFSGIPLADVATVDHLPRLGHTQLLAEDREQLIETIAGRLAAA